MYDTSSQNPLGQIQDVDIKPLPGHQNPFTPGTDRSVTQRSYEVRLAPEESVGDGDANTITIPDDVKKMTLLLRVYRADDGRDATGGVGLPKVEVFDVSTEKPARCPRRLNVPWEVFKGLVGIFMNFVKHSSAMDIESVLSEEIFSCRVWVAGFFPQGDNPYIAAPISREFGEVAAIRFQAPDFPRTAGGGGRFTGEEDVRYFSACMCDFKTSGCSVCIPDDRMSIDEQGFVNIAVGPENIASPARDKGWTYFAWEDDYSMPMLLFRQMKPRKDFEGSFLKVPEVSFKEPLEDQIGEKKASNHIGDYAPRGHYCSAEELLANECGLKKGQR